jgi:hypothetical protein
MSWKKSLNSMAAASRRAERESRKRQRELEKRQKEIEKMEELERATFEVEVHQNYIEVLRSTHKDCGKDWDWKNLSNSPPPKKPKRLKTNETQAQNALSEYKPGLSDKLLKRTETKRLELEKAVETARQEDEQNYQLALEEYKLQYDDWKTIGEIGKKILAGNTEAYTEAVEYINPLAEIDDIGTDFKFIAHSSNFVEGELYVHSDDVIPDEVKTVLKSGKLSIKKMTKTNYYGLYQDYVCGCVLRVAREIFAILPVEMIIVTAFSNLLNTKTGHIEEQPILSVAIPEETLDKLNFEMIDPSDSMENFVHNMKFAKTKGFNAVEKVDASKFYNPF